MLSLLSVLLLTTCPHRGETAGELGGVGFADLLPLREIDLQAATKTRYGRALARFCTYARANALSLATVERLDDALELYVNHLFILGQGRANAVCAYAAANRRWPRARGRLLAAEQSLRHWGKARPGASYHPIPFRVALLLAEWLVGRGWIVAAAAVIVAHRGLLRVGELLRLRGVDIILEGAEAVLRLVVTKTGGEQPVRIRDRGVVWILARLKEALTEVHAFAFNLSYAKLRAQFRTALRALGLNAAKLVFHSLRHGGATDLFLKDTPLDNIAIAGRWRSLTTTRRYVSTGVALLTQIALPARSKGRAEELEKRWPYRLW